MTCRWCQIAQESFEKAEDLVNNMRLSLDHPAVKRCMTRGRGALAFAAHRHGPTTLAGCPVKDEK